MLQFDGLFSQLGGAISLFLGISVIMVFEVLELIGDLVTAVFKYLLSNTKTSKNDK